MYIYLIQPHGLNSDIYKIGMSKKQDLSRLKSYQKTARYIRMAEIGHKYKEAEDELILLFNQNFELAQGKEYFRLSSKDDELKAIDIFSKVCNKYFTLNNTDIVHTKNYGIDNILSYTLKCRLCDFVTQDKNDFSTHLGSNSCTQSVDLGLICSTCFEVFSNKLNRIRHEDKCKSGLNSNNITMITYESMWQYKIDKMISKYIKNKRIVSDTIKRHSTDTYSNKLEYNKSKQVSISISNKIRKTRNKESKLILEFMEKSDYDIMDTVEDFDEFIKHNIQVNYEKNNSKFKSTDVIYALSETLLNLSKDVVVSHRIKNLNEDKDIQFKLNNRLCSAGVLEFLFQDSKFFDRIDVEEVLNGLKTNKEFYTNYEEYNNTLKTKAKKLLTSGVVRI